MSEDQAKPDLLIPLRELLSTPDRWTQRAYARDAEGKSVLWKEASAVCWCLDGAILKAYSSLSGHRMPVFIELRKRVNPIGKECPSLAGYNDRRGFDGVQELLREPFYG